MKAFVAGHEAVTAHDLAELSLGLDVELFAGSPGESRRDRRVRQAVAREALADLHEAGESDELTAGVAALARSLLRGRATGCRKAVA
ncbi:hypothetical protein HRW23_20285 [Streptomyces lunaelactis]|uniref:hypothetical protein n=1 Tax=Streptomyces lunaelactis TaxID=1535768 RepID=UPI0015858305|nr:hypothetical protein [Streptomyces lunaelactis]NUK71096.1 hypothetical protein [Streptomyces lunaelactis]NUK79692.1 hypothetical protein [Streptomyces lunaelactis]